MIKTIKKYSTQAEELIKNMNNFDKADFEKWFEDTYLLGSGDILRYLMTKKEGG